MGVRSGYSIERNTCVFEFNALESMNGGSCCPTTTSEVPRIKSGSEPGGEIGEEGRVSCMENHGGPNCTNAFGIYQGRCPLATSHCMDYNGFLPNCSNPSGMATNAIAFPGSDCFVAIAMGQCWNEM